MSENPRIDYDYTWFDHTAILLNKLQTGSKGKEVGRRLAQDILDLALGEYQLLQEMIEQADESPVVQPLPGVDIRIPMSSQEDLNQLFEGRMIEVIHAAGKAGLKLSDLDTRPLEERAVPDDVR